MKKVFFFDIDGTLLPLNQDNVTAKTKYAIGELLKQKHEVFIATGKSILHAKGIGEAIGVNNFIATNGQIMYRNDEVIYENGLAIEDLKLWEKIAKERNVTLGFQGTFNCGIFDSTEENYQKAKKFFKDITIDYPDVIEEIPTDYKVGQLWLIGDIENINPDPEKYNVVKWPHTGADVLPVGVNKAEGIKQYLKRVDQSVTTYAFGDGHNDIEMFDYVDIAVAMDNADELVKSRANVITKSSDEDGIYHYLVQEKIIGALNE